MAGLPLHNKSVSCVCITILVHSFTYHSNFSSIDNSALWEGTGVCTFLYKTSLTIFDFATCEGSRWNQGAFTVSVHLPFICKNLLYTRLNFETTEHSRKCFELFRSGGDYLQYQEEINMELYKLIGIAINTTKLISSRDIAQNISEQNKNSICEDPGELGSILTHTLLDKRRKVRCGDRWVKEISE